MIPDWIPRIDHGNPIDQGDPVSDSRFLTLWKVIQHLLVLPFLIYFHMKMTEEERCRETGIKSGKKLGKTPHLQKERKETDGFLPSLTKLMER